MNVIENLRMALGSLMAHKMRSILTMLGIIIGVGAVIIVVAIGQGGEAMLKEQFSGAGNTVELLFQPPEEEMEANPNLLSQAPFKQEDIRALEGIQGVKKVVATSSEFSSARFREKTVDASVTGMNNGYLEVNGLKVKKGRNFSSSDFLSGRRVGLISHSAKEELFEGRSPVGEIIRIANQPVEVIGVLEKPSGLFAFGSVEVYLPSQTWRSVYGKSEYSQVALQADSADELKAVGEEAAKLLNNMHGTKESYQVINIEEITEGIGQVTRIMTMIIGSIAGISLFVGGIGVMNIMLVSVTERTREIGIRMALGATRGQVMTQFLIESITLTLVGGIIGIFSGWGIASLVSAFAGWPSLVSWQVVVGGLLFSMIIGIIFGLLPANKASKLDPIDSLRYE
ncbi:ABC transporter permease [Bacillus massilinigeriensis]|uniref:ABC transporter permease n=1 Tax=Bacillus mediterraneensis TaxID=1805474 RepID=UPI0008F7FE6D|nr:ABC transporter permease [Bacillus mediterraneensis]